MSVKFHRHNFLPPTSTSPQWVAQKSSSVQYVYRVVDFDNYTTSHWSSSRKRHLRFTHFENRTNGKSCKYLRIQSHHDLFSQKSKRVRNLIFFSASDDGVTLNGSPKSSMSRDVEAMRIRLNEALQNGDYNDGLVQALHDAARVFELLLKERSSLSKISSWFSLAWFGVDNNGWAKSLSYQASLYALLQAAVEMSSRGDGRDRDVNVIVQKSLLRLSAPLESIIREKFSGKQPHDVDWFWSDKMPVVVTTFVDHFKRDPRFKSATMYGKRTTTGSINASDISLVVLALVCTSMIMKLGPAKVSSSQLFSIVPDITSSLMGVLVGLMPIHETYQVVKEIGLHREFLIHFGPRAASCGVTDNCISDEIVFWVDLVQKQLQRAIDKEKIWSRLTTSESIEVLEKDLAIFGFFVALGRSTRSFLASNGFDKIDEPIEGFIRYLIGGCIIFYPQLSSISSYELYVEVICEELDWFSFYPGYDNTVKRSYGHKSKSEVPLNVEAVSQALDVCSHWIRVFIKHSKWVDNPSNIKAARFLSKGHDKLEECKEKLGLLNKAQKSFDSAESSSDVQSRDEPYSFDKALESVEETLLRLEKLIQEMHVSSVGSGKELLKAACSDLEKIRRLKKEAEFLEMSFRAKADSLQENKGVGAVIQDKNNSKRAGFWAFLVRFPWKKPSLEYSEIAYTITDTSSGSPNADVKSDADEIHRFKLLRSELMELEKRVQRSATQSQNEEDSDYANAVKGVQLVQMQKNESFMGKSLAKLKETSTDVWQGTQLLAIDVAASMCLLQRTIIGDEITEKEKKFLRRTLTDLASVVPIGFLMLLPVTAVGHAAMLAAIQRYAPSLIPSTYGPERLDLLRQVQKMKQSDTGEANKERNLEEID